MSVHSACCHAIILIRPSCTAIHECYLFANQIDFGRASHCYVINGCASTQSGDIFQLVLSQRFERRTFADPFEVYRALRVVNPSPYMVYMQARGCILVSSSPEILCR